MEPYPFAINTPDTGSSQNSGTPGHRRDPNGSILYKPYAGFGQSKSKHANSESLDALMDGDQLQEDVADHRPAPLPLPDPATIDSATSAGIIERDQPIRSNTAFSASTLVAEDGSEYPNSNAEAKPILKVRSHLG